MSETEKVTLAELQVRIIVAKNAENEISSFFHVTNSADVEVAGVHQGSRFSSDTKNLFRKLLMK